MSTQFNPIYGSPTTLLSALSSISSAAAYQTASVNNTSLLGLEIFAIVQFTMANSTPGSNSTVNIYAAGSLDGSLWPGEGSGNNDGVTGSAGSITLESPTNLIQVGIENVPTQNKTYITDPIPLSLAWVGTIPPYWSIIIANNTGQTISSITVKYVAVNTVTSP